MLKDKMKKHGASFLINYDILMEIAGDLKSGILLTKIMMWFDIKSKFYKGDLELQKETFLRKDEFKSAKAKIKKLSFLKITREGNRGMTFYQLDENLFDVVLEKYKINQIVENPTSESNQIAGNTQTDKINQIVEKPQTDKSDSVKPTIQIAGNTQSHILNIHTKYKEKTKAKVKTPLSPIWIKMATRLFEMMKGIRKIEIKTDTTKWAKDISMLHTKQNIPKKYIRDMLHWYVDFYPKHRKEGFLIEAHSGASFRAKFEKIIDMKDRQEKNNHSSKKKSIFREHEKLKNYQDWILDAFKNQHLLSDEIKNGSADWMDECLTHLKNLQNAYTTEKYIFLQLPQDSKWYLVEFCRWLAVQACNWPEWNQTWNGLRPGEKHWIRFFRHHLKQSGMINIPEKLKKLAHLTG